ncbi:MAG: serine/threonine-protein phosphatase [Ectothiorhodospiraceae bacterium]|nr:serine/threonine-protein phosphatase [Chromatiales bacterium]MCP5155672.1 serine/threonine-protein phosphatase [Ectothiorhodospiraceae bacterium]
MHHAPPWTSSSRTDPGMVREVNEDACVDRPQAAMWAVADGMGGHQAGDLASTMLVEALCGIAPASDLGTYVELVEDALLEVNTELRTIAEARDAQAVGSTVAVLLAGRAHAVCMWAGDSRIYRYRAGRLERLTQDHALVEELIERGMLSEEEAIDHPHANLVTRAVGAGDELNIDLEMVEIAAGDVFVLCSDGLDKAVRDEAIADVLAHATVRRAADELVELALEHGARDNVTVVVVGVLDDPTDRD